MTKNTDNQRSKLRRQFEGRMRQKQDQLISLPGILGDGLGNIETGIANTVYVRVAQSVTKALCLGTPHIYDLPVWVGYTNYLPHQLQVLSTRIIGGSSSGESQPGVPPHAASHEYFGEGSSGGTDVLKVHLQQFLPFRVFPVNGDDWMVVGVYPGIARAGGVWRLIADQNIYGDPIPKTLDLSTYMPSTSGKAKFVLITLDTAGVLVITDGSEVDIDLLAITDIPTIPTDTQFALAAVRLWYGQDHLVENRGGTDIVDLRFPIVHFHDPSELLDMSIDDLNDVTITGVTNGEVLVYSTSAFINMTLAEANIAAANHLHTGVYAPYVLNKLDATTAPTANDDSGDGYAINSVWIDVTADKAYICVDATVGAAVWNEVGGGGHEIQNAGSAMTQRTALNFIGFDVTDDALNDATEITFPAIELGDLEDVNPAAADTGDILWFSGVEWQPTDPSEIDYTAIHDNVANEISEITEKTTPVGADLLLIEDSGASYVKKKVQIDNLPGWVYLTTPLTSTSWDGDSFSTTAKTLIDLSAVFSAPAGVQAIMIGVSLRDSGSASGTTGPYVIISPNSNNYEGRYCYCAGLPNDAWTHEAFTVPCDANGDIYYQINASGSDTAEIYLQIWGYLPSGAVGGGVVAYNDANAIHDNTASEIHAITEKTSLADDDEFLIEDSADSYNKKRVKKSNLGAGGEVPAALKVIMSQNFK